MSNSTSEPISREKLAEVLEIIRPSIQSDNGDIALVDVDDSTGVVTVELMGACVGCPASAITMKAGVERILKDRVPGVVSVVQSGEELADAVTSVDL